MEIGWGRRPRRLFGVDDAQVHVLLGAQEREGERIRSGGGAMLHGQQQRMLPATQGECGIHPGKEIAGSAQADATGGGSRSCGNGE
jgi:hypothetical protein